MHELGLLRDLMRKIERIAREQSAPRVSRVRLRLGALAHLSPEHLREHFAWAAAGGVAEGAMLEIAVATDPAESGAQGILLESVDLEEPEAEPEKPREDDA